MTVEALVDDLFRRSSAELTAALVRLLGPARFDLAEEVVQDALVRALETWSFSGVPGNPRGWLFNVARNRALDLLRRDASYDSKLRLILTDDTFARIDESTVDAELAMIFMCCDPALPRDSQVALTLKSVGGFSVKEIAGALLAEPATVAQRLVRAKRLLVENQVAFTLPADDEMRARRGVVLDVLYLMFTEGYAAHDGDELLREELCRESIRLARLLAADARSAGPPVDALLSLMLLQASRFRTRTDDLGNLLLLDQQDRTKWDRAMIMEGLRYLDRASTADEITPFHVQAAIAAVHGTAPSSPETDWSTILRYYDQLLELAPNAVVQLNRAVALAHVRGPHAGLAALKQLSSDPVLRRYYLLPAVTGGLWLQAGEAAQAAESFERAIALAPNAPERRFLERRLAQARETAGTHPA